MCLLLREALTVGRISFHKDFHSNEMSDDEARRRVVDEMMNYCVVTEPPKTTFGKLRKTYTGKLYGRQDDVFIAVQLAMIGCSKFCARRTLTRSYALLLTRCALLTQSKTPSTAPSATTITRRRRASPTIHSRRQPLASQTLETAL